MNTGTLADDFDARFSRLDGAVEQLGQRMSSLEIHMNNLEVRMNNLEVRMDTGFRDVNARIDSVFRWIVGIQITTLVALGTLIFAKL